MEFELNSTQRLMQQTARAFLSKECSTARVRQLMETEAAYDESLWRAMAEQGWLGFLVPESAGGLGLGVVELAAVAEELGRACLPGPWMSSLWASATLVGAGADGHSSWLEQISQGERLATIALFEPRGSWDLEAVTTRIEKHGNQFRLSGRKALVLDAAAADQLLVAARDEGQFVLVAVDTTAKGVATRATPGADATRKLYEVDFANVELSAEAIIARGEAAEKAYRYGADVASVALCAEQVGIMGRLLEMTVEYAATRQQFGRPIAAFQAVQHMCADMLLLLESARSATYYAAWSLDERLPEAEAAVPMAKNYCSSAAREVANRAVQVHGGIGFTWEHDLQLFYKRIKASELMLGDSRHHRQRLASWLLDGRAN